MKEIPSKLLFKIEKQAGLVGRHQLHEFGFRNREIDVRLRRNLWTQVTTNVISLAPPEQNRKFELMVAVLELPNMWLTGAAALELDGLKQTAQTRIDVMTTRGKHNNRREQVRLHTSTIPFRVIGEFPRRTEPTVSVVYALAHAPTNQTGLFYLTWALQNKLTTLEKLTREVRSHKNSVPHGIAAKIINSLHVGAESSNEQLFVDECLKRGFPMPELQAKIDDSSGKLRYYDAVFRNGDDLVVVEVDGIGHLSMDTWSDDQLKTNEIVMLGGTILRVTSHGLKQDPNPFFKQLERALERIGITRRPQLIHK